jgi:threonine aldolase
MAFPDGIADFRSDTVTRPTDEMRRAMADAVVGDDVYGEDPTVNALESEAAELLGKEAALFVPSGTMGNQIAINLLSLPASEVVCVESAHVRNYERGAAGFLSGVSFRTVPSEDGVMTAEQIATVGSRAGYGLPHLSLLVWENTHVASGGSVVQLSVMSAGTAAARDLGLNVHLDGARLFNAETATGVPAAEYAALADTVMCCFSKGLGAPIGSILAGSGDRMEDAREIRKRLGGGMRQVGVLAAAARIALRDRERLAEDHELAARLAAVLEEALPGAAVSPPETNMVLVETAGSERLVDRLARHGIEVGHIRAGLLRFCTHRDVDGSDVDRIAEVLA